MKLLIVVVYDDKCITIRVFTSREINSSFPNASIKKYARYFDK